MAQCFLQLGPRLYVTQDGALNRGAGPPADRGIRNLRGEVAKVVGARIPILRSGTIGT